MKKAQGFHMQALDFEPIPLRVLPWWRFARGVLVLRLLGLPLVIARGLLSTRLVAAIVCARRVHRRDLGERHST